jgi:hypothetical protein
LHNSAFTWLQLLPKSLQVSCSRQTNLAWCICH